MVNWLPPAVKYIDDSLMYEIRYVANGSPMRKVNINMLCFQEYILIVLKKFKFNKFTVNISIFGDLIKPLLDISNFLEKTMTWRMTIFKDWELWVKNTFLVLYTDYMLVQKSKYFLKHQLSESSGLYILRF